MFSFGNFNRVLVSCICAAALTACQPGAMDLSGLGQNSGQQQKPAYTAPKLSPSVNGEKVGSGPIRVALLVPISAAGGGGVAGKQIVNAAKLAMKDFGAGRFQLVIKDTAGQASAAQTLASESLTEGASLILGPLFSGNVSSASAITVPSKKPMIAFSSDSNRARAGVYLLSFAPQADIARTLNYGISQGANRIVALLPKTAYGTLAEQELKKVASANNATVVGIGRYDLKSNSIVEAAHSMVLQANQANAIYIPGGGPVPALILKSMKSAGAELSGRIIMGSGQWETIDKKESILDGAVYAGADRTNFESFAVRYNTTYAETPTSTAALGYDAVSLAAELVRRSKVQPFSAKAIQSSSGFRGISGLFRFKSNGQLQRGLAVNKISGGQTIIVSPAPVKF